MKDVYVIGVDTLKFDRYLERSIKDLAQESASACLKDASLEKSAIQALWFANSGWGYQEGQDCIRGQVALRGLGIQGIPITNVENACAGGSTAFHHAWMGVASGLYDVTMAVGAEKLYNRNKMAMFAGFLGGVDVENLLQNMEALGDARLGDEDQEALIKFRERYPEHRKQSKARQRGLIGKLKQRLNDGRDAAVVGISLGEKLGYKTVYRMQQFSSGDHSPFMDIYGHAARQHMNAYGTTVEQLAAAASKSHFNGALNPKAQYQFRVPVDEVLRDRIVSYPITRAMCAPIGDGAASAILCSARMVHKLGLKSRAVKVRASVLGSGMDYGRQDSPSPIGERLALRAYDVAGLGPEDINLAEVHDATAFGEIVQSENLGFCARGEGGPLAEEGATALGGRIPINTSGGLTARGHPVGASGLAQLHELVIQLRGEAGQRQLDNPRLGIAENGGGALGEEEAAMCIHILEAPAA